MNRRTRTPSYLILLLAFSQLAAGGEVFTWIDAGGVTHFSEVPPGDVASGVARVELPTAPAGIPGTGADYYSVINQVARMEARRLQREKLRAERLAAEAAIRKARAEELAALETARQPTGLEEPRYYPLYLHHPRPGHWPHRPPRPSHYDHRRRDTGSRNYLQSRRNDMVW